MAGLHNSGSSQESILIAWEEWMDMGSMGGGGRSTHTSSAAAGKQQHGSPPPPPECGGTI